MAGRDQRKCVFSRTRPVNGCVLEDLQGRGEVDGQEVVAVAGRDKKKGVFSRTRPSKGCILTRPAKGCIFRDETSARVYFQGHDQRKVAFWKTLRDAARLMDRRSSPLPDETIGKAEKFSHLHPFQIRDQRNCVFSRTRPAKSCVLEDKTSELV